MNAPAAESGITVHSDGNVRIVTIERGELNTVDQAMHEELAEIWNRLESDPNARAVVLRSEGRHFTAGGDFGWFLDLNADLDLREQSFKDGQRIIEGMLRFRLPVVTAVTGGAVGLGASLAMLSDYIVMSENSFLRDPHVSIGLTAGDGGLIWPFSMGMHAAKQYLLLGDKLPAEEAYRLGVANVVAPREEVDDRALEVAHRFAALPAQAVQTTKRALNLLIEQSARGAMEYALAAERLAYHLPEFQAKLDEFRGGDK